MVLLQLDNLRMAAVLVWSLNLLLLLLSLV